MRFALFLSILLMAAACIASTNGTIRSAAELYAAVFDAEDIGREFDLTVQALIGTTSIPARFVGEDPTGGMTFVRELPKAVRTSFSAGDQLHIQGQIHRGKRSRNPYADCRLIEVLGHDTLPLPRDTTIGALQHGECDCHLVRVRGTVRDVFRDEIDPGFNFLILMDTGTVIYVPFDERLVPFDRLNRLVGTEVSVVGICSPMDISARRKMGRLFYPADGLRSVQTLRSAAADPFSAPELKPFNKMSPQEIALLCRHRTCGRVIARWGRGNLLIKTNDGQVVGVTLSEGPLPEYGTTIDVVGFPESDLYRINLSRAVWRPSVSAAVVCDETPKDIDVDTFLRDERGRRCFNAYAHGWTLRLVGQVISLPGAGNDDGRLTLKNGDFLVPVDFSSQPKALMGLEVGCRVEVTGTCVMESENWLPNAAFPRIRGFTLVVRTPADVRILARPPWWTPGRLAVVIGSLLAALVAILIWNASLRRIAERRSRELFRSQIAQTSAALKIEERTRLAVALHDAISQNLSGASMRIDAARKLLEHDHDSAARQLDIASNTLGSCREELRNCIWDLRNEALDERDMNEAIRRTLARHLGEAALSVRFNIPRTKLSDNTTNAILCIIRELSVNAIRHGRATEIKVAGSIDRDRLLFSVRDNGKGFELSDAPGTAEGHFGLQGVRERLKRLGGTLALESRPGKGTKAVAMLELRQNPQTDDTP